MTTGTYTDKYLAPRVTTAIEERATAYVTALGPFVTDANDWAGRLTTMRVYVETCLDCQATADDVFAQKLTAYRKEFESLLAAAKAASRLKQAADGATAGTASAGLFTINIDRG